jgi:hypothetical protein
VVSTNTFYQRGETAQARPQHSEMIAWLLVLACCAFGASAQDAPQPVPIAQEREDAYAAVDAQREATKGRNSFIPPPGPNGEIPPEFNRIHGLCRLTHNGASTRDGSGSQGLAELFRTQSTSRSSKRLAET